MISEKPVHRALILQGGGALGAYEVGALKAFCHNLAIEDANSNREGQPMFDIVAGSSIGAVNAAILVDNVINPKNKNADNSQIWNDAVDSLEQFYEKISDRGGNTNPMWWIDNVFLKNPFFQNFWPNWANFKEFLKTQSELFFNSPFTPDKKTAKEFVANSPFLDKMYFNFFPDTWGLPASSELARRYYSYLLSVSWGSPDVLSPAMIQPDMKFLDPFYFTHIFARFNNAYLAKTMKNFCHSPLKIKTENSDEKTHPRLLIISVDVEDITTPVVFDSFAKKKHWTTNEDYSWYSEYGLDSKGNPKFRIDYDGIELKHIEASMATPIRFDYPQFPVMNLQENKIEQRTFWDGAFLANTPLRQVMRAHRQYWKQKDKENIPDLEIFIVNLYPSIEHGVPTSPDSIQDRQIDITFHDRTKFQVKIDKMRSEYIDLLQKLLSIAKKNDIQSVNEISEKSTTYSTKKDDVLEKKSSLWKNRFKLRRVVYVERKEKSGNTIFAKAFDFSPDTIKQLIKEGEDTADEEFVKCTNEYHESQIYTE